MDRHYVRCAWAWLLGLVIGCSQDSTAPGPATGQMDTAARPTSNPPSSQSQSQPDPGRGRSPASEAGRAASPQDAGMAMRAGSSAPDSSNARDAAVSDDAGANDEHEADAASGRHVLLVANKDVGTVELFDAKSFSKLGSINVIPDGTEPQDPAHAPVYAAIVAVEGLNYAQHILVSPDGATLYVARGWLGDVVGVDIASGALKWRLQTTSFRADHMALSPDGRRLFVSALSADQVQAIDPIQGQFEGMFPTGTWPHGMEFSHDGKKLYTGSIGNILLPEGSQGIYELTVSDPESLTVLQTFPFDAGIRPFVLTHDDKLMYTQLSWLHGLVEVELATGKTLRTIELPISADAMQVPRADYPNDAAHHGLAMSHDGEVLCAAGTLSDYVALIARSSFELIKTIPVGDEPGWTVTSIDGQYCFAGARGAHDVSVISYAEQKEVARIPLGGLPQHLLTARIPESVLESAGFR